MPSRYAATNDSDLFVSCVTDSNRFCNLIFSATINWIVDFVSVHSGIEFYD